jgi:hypothetical protein
MEDFAVANEFKGIKDLPERKSITTCQVMPVILVLIL